jgi:hypothetical protein
VQQVTKIEMVVNLKTAKALAVNIPLTLTRSSNSSAVCCGA